MASGSGRPGRRTATATGTGTERKGAKRSNARDRDARARVCSVEWRGGRVGQEEAGAGGVVGEEAAGREGGGVAAEERAEPTRQAVRQRAPVRTSAGQQGRGGLGRAGPQTVSGWGWRLGAVCSLLC